MNVLEDKEQCSYLKKQLERGYKIPLSVITCARNGIIEAHSCIPTNSKPLDVTKLPPISSKEWKAALSLLMKTEQEKGYKVKWFESAERALYFIEVYKLSN